MKTKLYIIITAIAAFVPTVQISAQDSMNKDKESGTSDERQRVHRIPSLGSLEKVDKIQGVEIKGTQDQKLGKIKELAIDLENGRIVEVIVTTGGFLGVDSKLVALPPQVFSFDVSNEILRLNMDQPQLKDAPEFKMSTWPQDFDQSTIVDTYQRYDLKPYFVSDTNAARAVSPRQLEQENSSPSRSLEHLGYVNKAGKVIGMSVKNMQDEKLGNVANLIADLPAGRLVEVVISSGGFLGMGNELSVVPPSAFHYNTEHDTLVLDTTKESLASAPHFKSSEWPELNQPGYVARVYRAYHIEPYFVADADSTAQNVRDRNGTTLTPLDQGSSDSDVEITRQIRKQIIAHKELSVNARNVKVITVNGRVTLRGPVNSEDEKRILIDIARSVASHDAAVNEFLDVKTTSQTTSSAQ